MGCGVGGTNHLKISVHVGKNGKLQSMPICGDTFGYMWDQDVWDRMISGEAGLLPCIACQRTLERNAAIEAHKKLLESVSNGEHLMSGLRGLGMMEPACTIAAIKAREGEDPERVGFALDMAVQFGASFEYMDHGLIVMREEDLVGMMSVLGFRTSAEIRAKRSRKSSKATVSAPNN